MNQRAGVDELAGFPANLARQARTGAIRVPPGEWGANEVVRHLIAVERVVWMARLTSIREESEPEWSWTEPGPEAGLEDASLDDLVARFAEGRERTVALLDSFDEATWARSGVHATYGRLDVAALVRIAIEHDAEHLRALVPPNDHG